MLVFPCSLFHVVAFLKAALFRERRFHVIHPVLHLHPWRWHYLYLAWRERLPGLRGLFFRIRTRSYPVVASIFGELRFLLLNIVLSMVWLLVKQSLVERFLSERYARPRSLKPDVPSRRSCGVFVPVPGVPFHDARSIRRYPDVRWFRRVSSRAYITNGVGSGLPWE